MQMCEKDVDVANAALEQFDSKRPDPGTGIVGVGPLRNAGFNVVTWDPRGFGKSGGLVSVDGPDFEGRDVEALIDFIAKLVDPAEDTFGSTFQPISAALRAQLDIPAGQGLLVASLRSSGPSARKLAAGRRAGRS